MNDEFRLIPEQASTFAGSVDGLFLFMLLVATFFTALIFLLIVFFALKYRRGTNANREYSEHGKHWVLEVTWSVIPLGLTMVMFGWGTSLFFTMKQPPADCLEIDVVAKQWMWKIQHREGRREINVLHVPVGQPVRLQMISEDVIHSFYVPAFRTKMDVLPGRYSTLWFEPSRVGEYDLFCAEYCGTSHSGMIGRVVVLEPAQYAQWLRGGTDQPPEVAGQLLFEQFRCNSCHLAQAAPERRCPPLEGIYGRTVALNGGRSVIANDEYLRESILDPAARVVAGFPAQMPTYQGQISEEGVLQLIAYIKTLRAAEPVEEQKGDEKPDPASPPAETPEKSTPPETPTNGDTRQSNARFLRNSAANEIATDAAAHHRPRVGGGVIDELICRDQEPHPVFSPLSAAFAADKGEKTRKVRESV